MPGVRLVLGPADMANLKPIVSPARLPGTTLPIVPRPLLCGEAVRHVGDAVAAVFATDLDLAEAAAEAVRVVYAPLPAVIGVEAALLPAAAQLHASAPGNVAVAWSMGDKAATDRAFAAAARTAAIEFRHNRVAVVAIEPRAALVEYDAGGGRYTFHLPTQGSALMRDELVNALGCAPAAVRVLTPAVGGAFGMKAFPYPEYVVLAEAARRTGLRIGWTISRTDSFLTDTQAREAVSHAEAAVDDDGRILAMRFRHLVDMGAYPGYMAANTATKGMSNPMTGLYDIPAVHFRSTGVLTNTAWTDSYRGAGKPEAVVVLEALMDEVAHVLGESPASVRRRHLVPAARLPFRNPAGVTYDSGDYTARLDEALVLADHAGFGSRRAGAERKGLLRGLGISCWLDITAAGPPERAALRLNDDGNLALSVGSQEGGQHHEAAYAAILRHRLGIAATRLTPGDSDDRPAGGGTFGAKSIVVAGTAIVAAADALVERARTAAAAHWTMPAEAVQFADGYFFVPKTNRRIGWAELAALSPGIAVDVAGQATPNSIPNGCHVCEVEIDPATGAVEIVAYSAVDDFGAVIDRAGLIGQVAGGIAQGLGQALLENMAVDSATGQVLSASLMDYAVPRAGDWRPFELRLVEDAPCRTNPLGAKGVGQAGTIGALAAAVNAVNDAMRSAGAEPLNPPASPLRVWAAIRAAPRIAAKV
jgi:carbon-monoxide dehydrogenase large subunit